MVAENAKQLSKKAFSPEQAKQQFSTWLRNLPPAREEEYMKTRLMSMVSGLPATDWDSFMTRLLGVGQYAAGSGTKVGDLIGNQISAIHKMYPEYKKTMQQQTPTGLTGKKQRQVKRDPEVLKLQKEFNRLYKGKYRPIAEDGIMGPQTEVAKLIMHRQERLEQAQQPTSPIHGLENAKKIDIGQMDLQRLTPQLYSMVLQSYKLTPSQLGRDTILDLSRTLRTYIERATKEVYNSGANYKDQVSRDKSIINMAFSMFTKEVPKEALLSK